MKIQEIRAESVTDALKKVRESLGAEAVILSTRREEGGDGVLVTAALPVPREARRRSRSGEAPVSEILRELRAEVSDLRETLIGGRGLEEGKAETSLVPPGLAELDGRLRENGVPPVLRRRIVEAVGRRASGVEVYSAAAEVISEILPIWPSQGPSRKPRVIAFVGPTGAGKTTTLAKLAGRLVHEAKKKVTLLSFDTYRVAAVEQIRAYADMLGVPLEVLFTPADAARAIQTHKDCDVILMDTAGRSPLDRSKIQELSGLLGAGGEVETLLVLSAATSLDVAEDVADRFAPTQPSGIVLTKLDETRRPGSLLPLMVGRDLPLAYLAAGQEVPADLERASAERMVARLLAPPAESHLKSAGAEL